MILTQPDPSAEDIDAVLDFLPALEQPTVTRAAQPETLASGDNPDTAEIPIEKPWADASPALWDFVQALYDHHFVSEFEFDWTEWQTVAERYVEHPELLSDVGLGTVRKLFTTHVRKEGFSEGHLSKMVRSGHITAILHRLGELRRRLPPPAAKA